MNRPNDISQADWDAADAIGEQVLGKHERGFVMWPLVIPAQEIAAYAIKAERERCFDAARVPLHEMLSSGRCSPNDVRRILNSIEGAQ